MCVCLALHGSFAILFQAVQGTSFPSGEPGDIHKANYSVYHLVYTFYYKAASPISLSKFKSHNTVYLHF